MITRHDDTEKVSSDRVYSLEARGNVPYLVLSSVQFVCRACGKGAYIDLTPVPIQQLTIKCGVCDDPLFLIPEDQFEVELQDANLVLQ